MEAIVSKSPLQTGAEVVSMTNERQVYTVKETALRLGVHFNTVYRLIAAGEIQAVRVGKRRFVSKAVLDGMLAGEKG